MTCGVRALQLTRRPESLPPWTGRPKDSGCWVRRVQIATFQPFLVPTRLFWRSGVAYVTRALRNGERKIAPSPLHNVVSASSSKQSHISFCTARL